MGAECDDTVTEKRQVLWHPESCEPTANRTSALSSSRTPPIAPVHEQRRRARRSSAAREKAAPSVVLEATNDRAGDERFTSRLRARPRGVRASASPRACALAFVAFARLSLRAEGLDAPGSLGAMLLAVCGHPAMRGALDRLVPASHERGHPVAAMRRSSPPSRDEAALRSVPRGRSRDPRR